MDRRFTGLAAAIGLAGVGTFVLVGYVQAAEERAVSGEKLVPVLVVDHPVAEGTPAEELAALVRTEQVPAKVRPADAVSDLAALEGLAADTALVPGEQVLASRFGPAGAAQDLAVLDGLNEVTVEMTIARAGGGRLVPGHVVDVLATSAAGDALATDTILRDVPVVAVVVAESGGEGVPIGSTAEEDAITSAPSTLALVTLAVSSDQTPALVTAAEGGLLWLARTPSLEQVRS